MKEQTITGNKHFDTEVTCYEKLWCQQYDLGVCRHIPLTETTLKDRMINLRSNHSSWAHLMYKGREWTYGESDITARKLAQVLLRLGGKKGDRVELIISNRPELIFSFMACFKTGMIAVGANPRFTAHEIWANLVDSDARIVVVEANQFPKIKEVLDKGGTAVAHVIVVDGGGDCREWDATVSGDFYELLEAEEDIEPSTHVDPDDIQILSYTGGTTGVSKGCCYTNRELVWHSSAWSNWFQPVMKDTRFRILVSLPIVHAYSITCAVVLPIVAGGMAIIGSSTKIDEVLEEIELYEPNFWPSVPALLGPIAHEGEQNKNKTGKIKIILLGTAPSTLELVESFKKVSSALLIEGYGLSEAVSCVTFNKMSSQKLNCVGLPISDTQVLIVDLETGKIPLSPMEHGEIIFRGPQMIQGYWQRPNETAKTIRDGWLYTGDIGYLDNDGYLHIVGRTKNMIIVGGFNVFPSEIDEVLITHPKVTEVVTVGAPHPRLGEVAASFVTVLPDEDVSVEELEKYCRERLTGYKVPKYFEILDKLPRTLVQKPDVRKLKAIAKEKYKPSN